MIKVEVYRTFDGATHEGRGSAYRYLQGKEAELVSRISHGLVKCDGKYSEMGDYVIGNLPLFRALICIRDDMDLQD